MSDDGWRRALGIQATYELDRIRAFSDSVFAVAITLAVLRFRIPVATDSTEELNRVLLQQWPLYVSYLAGFGLLGWFWFNHHRLFQLLTRADGSLLWLNLLYLLFLVVLPFSTIVLGETRSLASAHLLFNLNACLTSLAGAGLWWYGLHHRRLVDGSIADRALRIFRLRSLVPPTAFALATALALVSPVAAIAAWSLIPLGHLLVRAVAGRLPTDEDLVENRDPATDVQPTEDLPAPTSRRSDRSALGLERLAGFADNIYAFAITVTVLRFRLTTPIPTTDAALTDALADALWPDGLAFLTGFVVTGMYWNLHLRTFVVIERSDRRLPLLDLAHLLAIALLPFASQLIAEFGNDRTAIVVYAGVATLAGGTLALITDYSTRGHRLVDPALPADALALRRRLFRVAPACFALSIPVAFVNPDLAQMLWFLPFFAVRLRARRALSVASTP